MLVMIAYPVELTRARVYNARVDVSAGGPSHPPPATRVFPSGRFFYYAVLLSQWHSFPVRAGYGLIVINRYKVEKLGRDLVKARKRLNLGLNLKHLKRLNIWG
jgi:hypothetical protein